MKRTLLCALLLATTALPAPASVIGPGSAEMTANGAFQHQALKDDLGSFTQLGLSGTLLYAFTDLLQAGGGMLVQHESYDPPFGDSASATAFGFEGRLRFNFGDSESVVPYLEGGVGFLVYSGDVYDDASTTIQPGGAVGMRVMVNDNASLNLSFGYVFEINALGAEDVESNTFLLGLGFSVFPRGLAPGR